MIIEDYNSYEMLYSKLNVMSEGTINIENRTEYGYTYSVRNDNVALAVGERLAHATA